MSLASAPLGIVLHAIGGAAAASFYIPFKAVRGWSWERAWITGGVFSWIICPLLAVGVLAPSGFSALAQVPASTWFWTWFFGVLWGIGGLTFGLTMRYLGVSLGYAVALGFCAVFGTLVPPMFSGQIHEVVASTSGLVTLAGLGLCLVGILCCGLAGMRRERDQGGDATSRGNLYLGLGVAAVSGILSSCMAFAFAAGKPIALAAVAAGTQTLWSNLPVVVVVLCGGFVTNLVWCGGRLALGLVTVDATAQATPTRNLAFCALSGLTWYLQFFFYGMGTTQMGDYEFTSWTLHMSFIIIGSGIWGLVLGEWRRATSTTIRTMLLGLAILVASTVVVGAGSWIASGEKAAPATQSRQGN